jgi:hypothetical protein
LITLKELQRWLETEQALRVSISAIDKFIRHKLGYRYKKTLVASEQQREAVAMAHEQWQAWQKTRDLSKRVFLDETGLSTDLIRRYGRARFRDAAPTGHWQTLTFIGLACRPAHSPVVPGSGHDRRSLQGIPAFATGTDLETRRYRDL